MARIFLSIITLSLLTVSYAQDIFHDVNAEIHVDKNSLNVIDIIHFKGKNHSNDIYFFLNENLNVRCLDEKYSIIRTGEKIGEDEQFAVQYKIEVPAGKKFPETLPLSYEGVINDEIVTGAAEYARGFSETKGIISEKGVYLAGSSYWIPYFPDNDLITFAMNVTIDSLWDVVSQGERTVHDMVGNRKFIRYESPEPMDEIFLVAAPWTEYQLMAGDVLVQAFLRTPDEKLATKYLNVTSDYIRLYENLIGKYPYKKFALVENFWETGYGMPSFTLLGEKVIRFPWILHSSYPHELLHNYWGNSVYVDYEQGNWCEGITAYMADHLIKEQNGEGTEYRRNTLQKYSDFVNSENDFPLAGFRSRNNPAEEAIGYGKSLMINEMLRYDLGDEVFLKAYSKFYADNKFRKASFDDIRKCFEEVGQRNLKPFFDQWIHRTGAPKLEISDVKAEKVQENYELSFTLSQIQKEDAFEIVVPLAIYLNGQNEVVFHKLIHNGREKKYSFTSEKEIIKIEVDPQYNVFRRLDKREVPNTLSQLLGSSSGVIILPSKSKLLDSYKSLAESWKQIQAAQDKTIEIITDEGISSLPKDKEIWIFGFENKYADHVNIPNPYFNTFSKSDQNLFAELKKTGSLVYAIPNPENPENTIGFLATVVEPALSGLSRKLLHYGKYSYLGFEGNEPTNVLKGVFPVVNSPLKIILNSSPENPAAVITPRKALSAKTK